MADRGQARRAARRGRWEALFPAWALAGAGAALSLSFLFQTSLAARAALFAAFLAAALASGKRVSLSTTAAVSAGIVAANLLVPVGRVLLRVGPFRVTETALLEGIEKALTFEGLVLVSKASIMPGLRLPGRFGSIVARAFVYYDRILEHKGSVRPASLVRDADELMLRVWEDGASGESAPEARPARPLGLAILGAAVVLGFLPFALL